MHSFFSRLGLSLAAVLLLIMAITSAKLALASWAQTRGNLSLGLAQAEPDSENSISQFDQGVALLEFANQQFPNDAFFLEDYARAKLQASMSSPGTRYPCKLGLPAAEALYAARAAHTRRPIWPYASMAIAQIKAHCGDFDAEFESALMDARKNGPHEVRIDRAIAEIWLEHSQVNSAALQKFGSDALLQSAETDVVRWVDRADQAGLADSICRVTKNRSNQTRCRELGWLE